jgi:kumamolisin
MSDQHHVLLPGSSRTALTDTQTIGPVDPDEQVSLTVVLRRRADLPGDLVEGSDTVSTSEFATSYGADPADVDRVRTVLEAAGVTVTNVDVGARLLTASGSAATVSALFGTELTRVSSADPVSGGQVEHRARTGELAVPTALDGIVQAVLGLDGRPQAMAHVRRPHAAQAAGTSYDPPTLAAAYGFPQDADGTGQVAAIVELGGGYAQSDLDTYFGGLHVTTPKVTAVGVAGGANTPGQDPDGADNEVLLDIEVLGALAPGAEMVVYFAPNTDQGFLNAVTTAVHATPTPAVVSISWGQSEDQWTAQARTAMDQAFADAAALGVTICVATGDSGSADAGTDGAAHVDFPASSPHALAVGGTSLTWTGTAADTRETVWNNAANGGATGGGVSDAFPLPDWQSNVGVPDRSGSTTSGRGVPDVAADADPATGYNVYVDGQARTLGGTSAAAPLWAALVCRLAQSLDRKVGLLQPVIYGTATAGTATTGFRDITEGDNGAYTAASGWDPCTGLGVPDGTALLTLLRDSQSGETGQSGAAG